MRGRRGLAAGAALLAAAAAAAGCSVEDERALRIGVLRDCVGAFRSFGEAQLSGAELPFLERGAELRGPRAADGVGGVTVAGRDVELVAGCTEGGEFTTVIAEVRRLVEQEHVDVVVAGTWPGDGIAMGDVAPLYPDVAFLPIVNGPREVTLRKRTPNLYRVARDYAQATSGLAAYAYRDLGWRRAAIVAEDWEYGWASAAAFAAEFCALGGTVAAQLTLPVVSPPGPDVAERLPEAIDGVAVLSSILGGPAGVLRELSRRLGDPARRIVVGPQAFVDGALRSELAPSIAGVVGTSLIGRLERPSVQAYRRAHAREFPTMPAELALNEVVVGFRDAVEAVLRALERAEGDLSDGNRRLHEELSRLRMVAVRGPVRIGTNGQAVGGGALVRLRRDGSLVSVRDVPPVDQSLGGLLAPSLSPDGRPRTCDR